MERINCWWDTYQFNRGSNVLEPAKVTKEDQGNSSMSEAFTQAALAISSALSPRPTLPSSQPVGTSPAKVVESPKCYKQLNDLNQLKASGIISEVEYAKEK